jgi:hypothetical protein
VEVVFSNVGRPEGLIYPGEGNINEDPFFGGGSRDFSFELDAQSPCIDTGDPAFPYDPDGTIVDMGAFSYYQGRSEEVAENPLQLQIGNYPNPFNPETVIRYELPQEGEVNIDVYNLKGQLVRTLTSGFQTSGSYHVNWNGLDQRDQLTASGIYLIRLQLGDSMTTCKAILAK